MTVEVTTSALVPPNATMELVVFEDTDGDGEAEHTDSQMLDSGINTYSMGLQGDGNSDYWAKAISDTTSADVTPAPSLDLVHIGEEMDVVEIYDDFTGGLDETLWEDRSPTTGASIYVQNDQLVLEHGTETADRPVVTINEDFGDSQGGYIDIDVSFRAKKELLDGQITFFNWWDGKTYRGNHNAPESALALYNNHNGNDYLLQKWEDGDGTTLDQSSVVDSTDWHDYRFVVKGNRDKFDVLGYLDGDIVMSASSESYLPSYMEIPYAGFFGRETEGATYIDEVDIKINKTPRETSGWRPEPGFDFRVIDDFERSTLDHYYGETTDFDTTTRWATHGDRSLEGHHNEDGGSRQIFSDFGDGLDYYPQKGDTIRWALRIEEGSWGGWENPAGYFWFGADGQSDAYYVLVRPTAGSSTSNVATLRIAKNEGGSGTTLASEDPPDLGTNQTVYVELDWQDTITLTVWEDDWNGDSEWASISATDSTFDDQRGIGFGTLWGSSATEGWVLHDYAHTGVSSAEVDETPVLEYQSTLPQTGMSQVYLTHTNNPSQVAYSIRSWDRKVYRYDLDTDSQVWEYQFSNSSSTDGVPSGLDFTTYSGGEYICWGGRFDDDNRGCALLDVTNNSPSQEFRWAPYSSWGHYGTTFSTTGQFFVWSRGNGSNYTFDHTGNVDSQSESDWRSSDHDWQNDDLLAFPNDAGVRIRNIDSSGNIGSTVFHDSNGGRTDDGEVGVALHPSDSIIFYWRDLGSTLRMYDYGSSSEIDTLSTSDSGQVECVEQDGRTIVSVFESSVGRTTVYEYDGGWNEIMSITGSGNENRRSNDLTVIGSNVYWTVSTEDGGDWTVEVWRI